MIHKQYDDVQWMEFELLTDVPLIHGCFMRHGGLSKGALDSLNLGKNVGDKSEHVNANFKKLGQALNLTNLVTAKSCHGSEIIEIVSLQSEIPISDGLTTSLPNLGVVVTQADCQAAIFYDPINHAMANVHCGWRGNVQNIYANTVKIMKSLHGSHACDLLVCISPSLGPEYSEFINYGTELPKDFLPFKIKECHFDLWAISEWQLKQAGVLSHHLQIARIDTYAKSDYFSHRRSTHNNLKPCGRQATVCALKSK